MRRIQTCCAAAWIQSAQRGGSARMLRTVTIKETKPGDPPPFTNQAIKEMIRVDLAGEMAACRICEAQKWWVSPLADSVEVIDEILEEEIYHRATMETLCDKYESKATVLDPAFRAGSFVMGVGTAMLGKEAIMCSHAAVEEWITEHYNSQLRELDQMRPQHNATLSTEEKESALAAETPADPEVKAREETIEELSDIIVKFRDDEQHHQELGEQNGAANAPFYPILYPAIQNACKVGIAAALKY